MSEANASPETFTVEPEPKLRFEIGDEVIKDYAYRLLTITEQATEESRLADGSHDLTRWDYLASILVEVYELERAPTRYEAKQIHQIVNSKVQECEDNLKKKLSDLLALPTGTEAVPSG